MFDNRHSEHSPNSGSNKTFPPRKAKIDSDLVYLLNVTLVWAATALISMTGYEHDRL